MKVRFQQQTSENQGGVTTYVTQLKAFMPSGFQVTDAGPCDVVLHVGPHHYGEFDPNVRHVVVVHDLIPELLLNDESVRNERERVLKCADAIIAVSEGTKADIVRKYGVSGDRIHVVHHGAPKDLSLAEGAKSLPRRYLLYVGKRNEYKRFRWFLRAVAPLMWIHPSLRIVCTGEKFCRREWAWIVALGLLGRIHAVRYSDAEMPSVYRSAAALVYPSSYEGFGLPVVEAMSYGCPVVLNRSSCLPEIAGEAALYFADRDAQGLRANIRMLLSSKSSDVAVRESLQGKGLERAKQFSWDRCAALTAAILKGDII